MPMRLPIPMEKLHCLAYLQHQQHLSPGLLPIRAVYGFPEVLGGTPGDEIGPPGTHVVADAVSEYLLNIWVGEHLQPIRVV